MKKKRDVPASACADAGGGGSKIALKSIINVIVVENGLI